MGFTKVKKASIILLVFKIEENIPKEKDWLKEIVSLYLKAPEFQ